jgi:hypothetical protein
LLLSCFFHHSYAHVFHGKTTPRSCLHQHMDKGMYYILSIFCYFFTSSFKFMDLDHEIILYTKESSFDNCLLLTWLTIFNLTCWINLTPIIRLFLFLLSLESVQISQVNPPLESLCRAL